MDARTHGRFVGALVVCGLVAAACAGLAAAADDVLAQGNLPGTYGVRFGPDGNLYVCALGAGIAVLDLSHGTDGGSDRSGARGDSVRKT